MALAQSRDGFRLLDEADNGLHFNLQANFGHLILQVATRTMCKFWTRRTVGTASKDLPARSRIPTGLTDILCG